jgi:hypothetical protein
MNNDGNGSGKIFKMPEDPRERAVWLRGWIQSLFKVYLSIIDQVNVAMPGKNIKQIEKEADAAKIELMHLIKPESWEKEDEPGKHKV